MYTLMCSPHTYPKALYHTQSLCTHTPYTHIHIPPHTLTHTHAHCTQTRSHPYSLHTHKLVRSFPHLLHTHLLYAQSYLLTHTHAHFQTLPCPLWEGRGAALSPGNLGVGASEGRGQGCTGSCGPCLCPCPCPCPCPHPRLRPCSLSWQTLKWGWG